MSGAGVLDVAVQPVLFGGEVPGAIAGQLVSAWEVHHSGFRKGEAKLVRCEGRWSSCLFEGELNATAHCGMGRHEDCCYDHSGLDHDPYTCTGHDYYRCPCPCHEGVPLAEVAVSSGVMGR